jgi:tetratricopeptide (TPR) repeat protein
MRSGDLRWSKRVDEIKKVVKREDYLKEVLEKKVGVYYLPKDYSISKFVHEIENAGLARKDIKRYFRVIVYPDFGPIVEIVGVTPNFNEIVTNSVFNKNNEYAGYSYVLSKDTLEKIEEDEINKSSDEVLNDWLILCKKAYEKSQNEDNWMSSAYGLMEIGMVYYFQNRLDEALKSYEKALKLSEEIANQVPDLNDMFIDNICGLAEVQSALGNHANAFINAKKAVDLAEEKGENHEKGNSQRTLGVVHRGMKEWEKAKEKLDKASEFFKDAGQFQQTRITYEYGLLCKAMGDMKIAEKYLEKAQSKFEWMGMRVWADKCRKDLEELRQ